MQISEFKMHNNKKMITWRPNETTGFGPPPLSACEPREGACWQARIWAATQPTSARGRVGLGVGPEPQPDPAAYEGGGLGLEP